MNLRNKLACFLAGAALCAPVSAAMNESIENATVRAETDGATLRLLVRDGKAWRPVLESVPVSAAAWNIDTMPPSSRATIDGERLRLDWPDPMRGVSRRPASSMRTEISLGAKPGHVRVVTRLRCYEPQKIQSVTGRWRFLGGAPDATWTPNLTPEPDQVIGQHAFRSPAVVVQKGGLAAVLLPDLDSLRHNPASLPATLNLDVSAPGGTPLATAPVLQMALQPHQVQRHVYWRHEPGQTVTVGPGEIVLAYDLLLTNRAEPRRAYRLAARWYGERQVAKNVRRDTLPQAVPWGKYAATGINSYLLPVAWRSTTMGGETVGGASMPSWGYADATWFQCWFNDLRSAYGTYLWGKWMDRPEVVQKARQTRQMLLNAPQKDGLFPAIYDWETRRWYGSTAGGGRDIYHAADCAWAAYWLLMWHRDLEKHPASIAFAKRLGDWMVENQKPSGEIPSFIRMDTMQPTDRLVESAETSGCGMFLALLARTTGEAKYMKAARGAAEHLRREIMPRNKWYDYETFYSCSGKPEGFYDARTDQHPQNNLSIHWAAELFRQLYLAEANPRDLADGEALMDYLNLYQQVWAPHFLTFEGFGGYGVQNTDAEWNDARQAQFACTNLDYYRLTGKPEYMERGIAALRAGFATTYMPENAYVSPLSYAKTPLGYADENYGHGGVDGASGPTSWDWGTGSALAAAAYARKHFGDVWVDADRGVAFGINGVTADWTRNGLAVRSSIQTVAPVIVKGAGKALPRKVAVNGVETPSLPAQWRDGFLVTPAADTRIRHRAPAVLASDNAVVEFEVWPYGEADVSVSVEGRSVAAQPVPGREGVRWARLPNPNSDARRLSYTIEARRDGASIRSTYTTEVVAMRPERALWSDAFTGENLDPRWRAEVPTPGPTVETGGDGLLLTVPGGRAFDQWRPQNDAPRILADVPEGDWSFTARLDLGQSPRAGNFQVGIAVELGDNDFAFWGPHQGAAVVLERSGLNGLGASRFNGPMPREIDVRARRIGDALWLDWRPAGGAWQAPVLYRVDSAPRRVGVILKTWQAMPARVTVREARMATMPAE